MLASFALQKVACFPRPIPEHQRHHPPGCQLKQPGRADSDHAQADLTTRATQKRTSLPPELLTTPAEYRIGNNDVLYITVAGSPELTAPSGAQQQIDANGRLVRSDGTLYYPFIKEVQATGRTIQQLRSDIEQRLSAFIAEPQVDDRRVAFRQSKSGGRKRGGEAGPQAISTNPLSVVEALGSAGIDTNNTGLVRPAVDA